MEGFMEIHGKFMETNSWKSMELHGKSMEFMGNPWKDPWGIHGKFMEIHGEIHGKFMEIHGKFMEFLEFSMLQVLDGHLNRQFATGRIYPYLPPNC